MLASFLLSLREGLEAALIIGIVLGVLLKIKRTDLNGMVWRGVSLAVLLSFIAAITLNLLGMEFEGKGEEAAGHSSCHRRRVTSHGEPGCCHRALPGLCHMLRPTLGNTRQINLAGHRVSQVPNREEGDTPNKSGWSPFIRKGKI